MRELIFRAWDKKEKKFITSFAVINGNCYVEKNSDDDSYVDVISDGAVKTYYSSWATYQKVDAELTQYTGLKDKNGKEIYEGDILQSIHGNYTFVYFLAGCFWAGTELLKDRFLDSLNIVGNKFENPELLESGPP